MKNVSLFAIICLLMTVLLNSPVEQANGKGGSIGGSGGRSSGGVKSGGSIGGKKSGQNRAGIHRNKRSWTNTQDDDEETFYDEDGPQISARIKGKKDTDDSAALILSLTTPDKNNTVDGQWRFYLNGKQISVHKANKVGSQSIALPIDKFDPEQNNQFRYTFVGKVNGRDFAVDKTFTLPTFQISLTESVLKMKSKSSDIKSTGNMMLTIRDEHKKIAQNCYQSKSTNLSCQISKLKPGKYTITSSYEDQSESFGFRKTGDLVIKPDKTGTLTLKPADPLPDDNTIETEQTQDRWDFGWVVWKNTIPSIFPKLEFEQSASLKSLTIEIKEELGHYTKGHFYVAFYNHNNKLLHSCKETDVQSSRTRCDTPNQEKYKFTVWFAGNTEINSRKFPISIEQLGTITNGEIKLNSPIYKNQLNPVEAKIKAAKVIAPSMEEDDFDIFSLIFTLIVLFFLFMIVMLTLVFVIRIIRARNMR